MNSESLQEKLDGVKAELNAEINSLDEEIQNLEERLERAKQNKRDKQAELNRTELILSVAQEAVSALKSKEEVLIDAVNRDEVQEVLDDLETQAEPDFKSARRRLNIAEREEPEDSNQMQAGGQAASQVA